MNPKNEKHSFLKEFNIKQTDEMFEDHKFKFIKNLSRKGQEQVYLYQKRDEVF